MRIGKFFAALGAGSLSAVASGAAWAQENFQGLETIGKPVPRGINLQPPVTEVAERLQWLDNFVLIISVAITLFVVALLVWIVIRYNKRANQTPATFTHNSFIEVIWTVVPILILIVIGSFSLPILFHQMEVPKADVTIKITGNQWYWTYEYTDNEFEFDSFMLGHPGTIEGDMAFVLNDETKALLKEYGYAEDEFLLATDTAVVVPVNQNIVLQITGADVIHSWAIPSFGVKLDAVPGRLAETWFNATKEGVYFGQCSELCGKDHAYMPITVKVVSQEVYDTWLAGAIDEYAGTPVPVALASN
ncbi:MAG: cytochrome c oxidase subunit 2 [Paracoccaceae bacterium]|jgi:cytochrome c oxidase subunit 2